MTEELAGFDVGNLAAGLFSSEELATYQAAGYGRSASAGSHPALVIVDVTYAFTGERAGGGHYPLVCGHPAWPV